ncbi:MAG TPA: penicillin-binding protein 2 [Mycobacteriales bacterium]|nr:penicillin-binding protein 2 [Mycobacteriales bacterium]
MNAPIKRVAIAILALFIALLLNINYVQVIDAASLRNNSHNSRILLFQYSHERGPIIVGGQEIAKSVPTGDSLKYLREYPGGAEFAPVTGFYSLVYGATGIEAAENSILAGDDSRLFVRRLSDLLTGRAPQGGAIVLTINAKAQQAAWAAMQGKQGAVVALDPRTGAILALVSSPSYDPSPLSSHNTAQIQATYQNLLRAPGNPLLDRALEESYPPGSMFKIVDLATAFSTGQYTAQTQLPTPNALLLPETTVLLHNFAGESCGNGVTDTIADAFRISCNTAFAGLGLKLGIGRLAAQAKKFGFGTGLSVPLPVAASQFSNGANLPNTALASIGQYDDAVTPLQAAMVSAAIANNGVLMAPYLVQRVEAPDLSTISQAQPQQLGTPVSPAVASQIKQLMELVVNSGTGTAAQIPGIQVAGKTGTANHGAPGTPPDAWFTAFAPADNPAVAVAVIVENGGGLGGNDATGGAVAAPIARAVIQAVIG